MQRLRRVASRPSELPSNKEPMRASYGAAGEVGCAATNRAGCEGGSNRINERKKSVLTAWCRCRCAGAQYRRCRVRTRAAVAPRDRQPALITGCRRCELSPPEVGWCTLDALDKLSTFNFQLSILNFELWTLNLRNRARTHPSIPSEPGTVNCQLPTATPNTLNSTLVNLHCSQPLCCEARSANSSRCGAVASVRLSACVSRSSCIRLPCRDMMDTYTRALVY